MSSLTSAFRPIYFVVSFINFLCGPRAQTKLAIQVSFSVSYTLCTIVALFAACSANLSTLIRFTFPGSVEIESEKCSS